MGGKTFKDKRRERRWGVMLEEGRMVQRSRKGGSLGGRREQGGRDANPFIYFTKLYQK